MRPDGPLRPVARQVTVDRSLADAFEGIGTVSEPVVRRITAVRTKWFHLILRASEALSVNC